MTPPYPEAISVNLHPPSAVMEFYQSSSDFHLKLSIKFVPSDLADMITILSRRPKK
jgi:hypothetical protein